MQMKAKIQENFNRAVPSYDLVASIQRQTAQQLIDYIRETDLTFSTVLDIGTGTGFVPDLLLPKHPNVSYLLNDLSPTMLDHVKNKFKDYPNITYQLGDAENTPFPMVDLIVSNLAFQWFENLEESISNLWQKTNVLAFSTLLEGTFSHWEQQCDAIGFDHGLHAYPSFAQLVDYCQSVGPCEAFFYQKTYTLPFKTSLEFMRYLKLLGANTPSTLEAPPIKKVLYALTDEVIADYKVFYGVLIKSKS
jgi:malonyl-CoA O-methyltransferase